MKPSNVARETVMYRSFFVNAILIFGKIIGGVIFRSSGLIADGIHSLSDFLSDVLVIFGLKHSQKPPDKEHPFGHGKIEYVLSLFLGMMILVIAYQLTRHVVLSFFEDPILPSLFAAVVSLFVIVMKLSLARYIMRHATRLDSQVLKASAQESFTDVLGSVVVIFGILLSFLAEHYTLGFLVYADNFAAIIIIALILRVALVIIIDAIKSILGKSASKDIIKNTRTTIAHIDGVHEVDKLTMIVYGHYYQVMVDIRVDGTQTVKEGHDIASNVKAILMKNKKIGHVIVHVNPEE